MHQTDNRDLLTCASICLVLAALALVVVFAGCGKRSIPTDADKPVLAAWVAVSGESMQPSFPAACYVETLIGYPYEKLQPGDTVIFWDYTRPTPALTHHRLHQKQGPWFIAKGDNPVTNSRADAPFVTRDNYIARTTGRWAYTLEAPQP